MRLNTAITGLPRKVINAVRIPVRLLGWKTLDERLAGLVGYGYWPHIKHPRSFNEKLAHRKLRDRDPLFVTLADKVAVRSYAEAKLAPEPAPLVPALGVYDDPDLIPWDELPRAFVVKTNHRSGGNILVPDKEKLDLADARKKLRTWFDNPYGAAKYEWFYDEVPRKILIEEFLVDPVHPVPLDYKLYTFHGRVQAIHVDQDRFTEHTRNFYDRDWNPLPFYYEYPLGPPVPRPRTLAKMVELAEKLCAGLEFVRVDLFTLGERVYLGEMTLVPSAGRRGYLPDKKYDFWLGSLW